MIIRTHVIVVVETVLDSSLEKNISLIEEKLGQSTKK